MSEREERPKEATTREPGGASKGAPPGGIVGPPPRMEPIKGSPEEPPGMVTVLQEGVQTGVISATGWLVLLSSFAVTVGWLWYLSR
jgi:hypothetical protein